MPTSAEERKRIRVRPADSTTVEIHSPAESNGETEAALTEQSEKLRNLGQRSRCKKEVLQWAKSPFQAMKQRGAAELLRFSKYFDEHTLKSEDFLGHQARTLKRVLAFLDLPDWESRAWKALDKGGYTPMDLSARRRLEDYFEPQDKRLYEYLGVDFGW